MILLFILTISIVQLITYYLLDKYKINIPSYAILILILVGHFFIFPKFLYPEEKIDCGMPILGITLAFWLFGTISAVGSHFVWHKILK